MGGRPVGRSGGKTSRNSESICDRWGLDSVGCDSTLLILFKVWFGSSVASSLVWNAKITDSMSLDLTSLRNADGFNKSWFNTFVGFVGDLHCSGFRSSDWVVVSKLWFRPS